ncbi:hypothetical protein OE88DRAFT_899769 [Heliocybe sulcata]|uniref:Uncharacterized protein n=1 Tax=Heliocybe sulcata TaxID=5364 RepID=A0A5C3MP53_9AGAM|nr:hypothetical protein OE88DRAFT_899769 [Heliocybe sulcata]
MWVPTDGANTPATPQAYPTGEDNELCPVWVPLAAATQRAYLSGPSKQILSRLLAHSSTSHLDSTKSCAQRGSQKLPPIVPRAPFGSASLAGTTNPSTGHWTPRQDCSGYGSH